jgi:hypothetical protein
MNKEESNTQAATEIKTPVVKELTEKEKRTLFEKKKAERLAVMGDRNPLGLNENMKDPDKKYRLCNLTPGNIERYESLGYRPVKKAIHKGTGDLADAKPASGSNEVVVGGKRGELTHAIWMETDLENAQILREIDDDAARAQEAQIDASEVPKELQIGSVKRSI